ncbi:MAG: iron donor protein CyaY [Buchnera aphidicola (Periphyllus lyropictus)]|uniref:iron donor protein CyaY n=1 Tax=Buchnera aphidicola TaxID=9 RepID=UPI001ED29C4E|nr:iron donor protein CyaY [Buchnera aphidicola]NIH16840.1 iron donor protein CyaY [Buchnera aphidicola (Periphyllus lyropictus)]USS94711.1 iron donor protein CyaY [Buchnera aphidicola (Periphyllus lyropictus)]
MLKKKILTTKKFHILVNKLILKIEKKLDKYNGKLNIDYESYNKILKINIKYKNEMIISRQEFLKQIWIATKYKGYYFKYKNKKWICKKNNIEIKKFLNNFFKKHIKENIFC